MSNHTPGPWFVRTRENNGEIIDCFVSAHDVNGFAYDAEILGDDEYREDIDRKLADARLIAAALDLLEAIKLCINAMLHKGVTTDSCHPERIALEAAEYAIAKATGEMS